MKCLICNGPRGSYYAFCETCWEADAELYDQLALSIESYQHSIAATLRERYIEMWADNLLIKRLDLIDHV